MSVTYIVVDAKDNNLINYFFELRKFEKDIYSSADIFFF